MWPLPKSNQHRTLRNRVALGVISFSLFIIVVHTAFMLMVSEAREKKLVDYLLQEEMDLLLMEYKINSYTHFSRSNTNPASLVVPYDGDQTLIPKPLQALPPGIYDLTIDNKNLRAVVSATETARFFLMYDVGDFTDRLSDFRWAIIISTTVGTIITIYLGFLLSGLLTRSVRDLAQRVENLTPGVYTDLVAENYADEEVAKLAHAFNNYAAKKRELVAREQEFTANVSHELRSPLTSIKSGCEILLDSSAMKATDRKRLESINDSVDRITELLSSLLYLARERTRVSFDQLNLVEFIKQIAEPFLEDIIRKNITLRVEVPVGSNLQTDKGALHIVLTNLLKNAIDYSDGGIITIRYAAYQLQIEDSGRGIAPEELPRIFERFYRGTSAQTEKDGLGLGLSIIKRICDQNIWDITVQSKLGAGTCFTLTLIGSRSLPP